MTILRFLTAGLIIASLVAILALPKNLPPKQEPKVVFGKDLPKLYDYPVKNASYQEPEPISARSAVVIDAKSAVTLFEKDSQVRQLPASTTKLMTALIALEKCSPEQQVTISQVEKEPTQMGLEVGDIVTVKTLLLGLLISSGNDAAFVLSSACAPSTELFVAEMNQKAQELSMKNTHFTNPAGFDDPNEYTTARDLAKLARVTVANPLIAKIVATKSAVATDVPQNKAYFLQNINKLLGEVEGIEGVKTGQTALSLETLITKTTRANHTIIVVILGSQDRFQESKNLIEWTFKNHQWVNP